MATTVDLGLQLEAFVATLVESGRYASSDAVVREALELLQRRESYLDGLDAALARGLADIEAGRVTPADEVFARLIAKYEAMAREAESHEAHPERRGAR